mgnify:CR=1 FL=1
MIFNIDKIKRDKQNKTKKSKQWMDGWMNVWESFDRSIIDPLNELMNDWWEWSTMINDFFFINYVDDWKWTNKQFLFVCLWLLLNDKEMVYRAKNHHHHYFDDNQWWWWSKVLSIYLFVCLNGWKFFNSHTHTHTMIT